MSGHKIELLSPAGEHEALLAALRYGADAVYIGGKNFGMRASPKNFEEDELAGAVKLAHEYGCKLYLACNTLPRGEEVHRLPGFIRHAAEAEIDGLIVADIGVLEMAKQLFPQLAVHISTQMGVVNFLTARTLYDMGASRVVLARELNLEEIAEIRAKTPPQLSLEAFVHGAVCVSVSGRCVISNYMTGRDANRGECAQPCRWEFALTERTRQGEYYPVYEEDGYSYILNANDLRMIEHLDKLTAAGVDSLKIEGRAKSAYYVAAMTGAYRAAVDALLSGNPLPEWALAETEKISHRPYSTGLYLKETPPAQDSEQGGYMRGWQLVATVDGYEDGYILCTGRNRFAVGEKLEALRPGGESISFTVKNMLDADGKAIETARHPMAKIRLNSQINLPAGAMLRRRETI